MKYYFLFYLFIFTIIRSTICSSQDIVQINSIEISGNEVTKEKIIRRELLFEVNDKVLKKNLNTVIEKSRENLLNTSLFNFVTVSYAYKSDSVVDVLILLQERWYVWPYPVLEHADRNLSSFLNNQEWSRIDYGVFVLINNFRGQKEILKLKAIFGHNNKYAVSYYNPFVNRNQKLGVGLDLNYFRNKELAYQINNNELVYLKLDNNYARNSFDAVGYLTYRPFIYTNHFLGIKYENVSVSDSIVKLNSDYFYNKNDNLKILSLIYNFDYDRRDSKIYPLNGFRFASTFIKKGIGVYSTEGPFYVVSILEENLKLANRFYLNTSIGSKLSFNRYNSFYFSGAIGFSNYIRGMEYYVSNGTNYYISKSNFKFEIIPQTKININFLPTDKFSKAHYALYFNLFFDTGYVDSKENITTNLSNEFLYSGGIGIDLVTYYDKILRIEYSLNKFGEHGIFFHLGAPIIE